MAKKSGNGNISGYIQNIDTDTHREENICKWLGSQPHFIRKVSMSVFSCSFRLSFQSHIFIMVLLNSHELEPANIWNENIENNHGNIRILHSIQNNFAFHILIYISF